LNFGVKHFYLGANILIFGQHYQSNVEFFGRKIRVEKRHNLQCPAAPSARAFDVITYLKKASRHCVQQTRQYLISIFWISRFYLDYSISTDKIGRIELAEMELADLGLNFPSSCKIGPATL